MSVVQLLHTAYSRLSALLATAPRGALPITGLLGLALVLYGFLQLRRGGGAGAGQRPHAPRPVRAAARPGAAAAAGASGAPAPAAAGSGAGATVGSSATPRPVGASATPTGAAVAAQLSGVQRVTVSLPGVVLAETSPSQLQESASVRGPAVVEVMREMARVADVYLLAHVGDDVGEAVVTGALEAAGLLGSEPGQVKPHHVLCCATLDGKVPIVRQLEPDLHIDAHQLSVDELKRFLPRLLLVREAGGGGGSSASNVGVAASLPAYFGL